MSQNFVKFQNLEAMFEPKMTLKFMKLSEKAQAPKKGSNCAAGFDLFSAVDVEIGSNDQAMISTDLKVAVPRGTYGRVAPRSGIAVDFNVHVGAGVIDEDYRGPLIVVLFNLGTHPFFVQRQDCPTHLREDSFSRCRCNGTFLFAIFRFCLELEISVGFMWFCQKK